MVLDKAWKYNLRVVVSDYCNYRCMFCSRDFNKAKGKSITKDFLMNCIAAFSELGGEKVSYTGGEPLLYPNLYEAMRYAKSLGLLNAVTTNGSKLDTQPDEFFQLASSLNVSMPSFNPVTYMRMTGSKEASLDKIKQNILDASSLGIRVKINAVYTEECIAMLNEMVDFFSCYGITVKIMNNMLCDKTYYNDFLKYASKWQGDSRVEIESGLNPGLEICRDCKVIRNSSCPSCHSIWVYPDQKITVCPLDSTRSFFCNTPKEIKSAMRSCWNIR